MRLVALPGRGLAACAHKPITERPGWWGKNRSIQTAGIPGGWPSPVQSHQDGALTWLTMEAGSAQELALPTRQLCSARNLPDPGGLLGKSAPKRPKINYCFLIFFRKINMWLKSQYVLIKANQKFFFIVFTFQNNILSVSFPSGFTMKFWSSF